MIKKKELSKRMIAKSVERHDEIKEKYEKLRSRSRQYLVFFTEETACWAKDLEQIDDEKYVLTEQLVMKRFPDGTLNGQVPDLSLVRDRDVLYLASFSDYGRLYEDYAALVVLAQSFPASVTIALPFFPSATMERVDPRSGVIATANIDAWMLTTLPSSGRMNRFLIFDIHTLANKFYFHSTSMADLLTVMHMVPSVVRGFTESTAIAFPDDGAAKRFGSSFHESHPRIICGKVRVGDQRVVHIKEGDPTGLSVLIVDDLVQSGGTLIECANKLFEAGASSVSAFVTHPVFPGDGWKKFLADGPGARLSHVYCADTRPTITPHLLKHPDRFTIIPIAPLLNDAL